MTLVNKNRDTGLYVQKAQEIKTKKNKRLLRSTVAVDKESEEEDNIEHDLGPQEIPSHLSGLEKENKENEMAIKDIIKGSFEEGDDPEKILCIRAKLDDKYCKYFGEEIVGKKLYAQIQWFKRKNGILPGPSFYPIEFLKGNHKYAQILVSYYEKRLCLSEQLIVHPKLMREDFW